MKKNILAKNFVLLSVLFFSIALIAWKDNQSCESGFNTADTTPKPSKKVRDLDEALAELEKSTSEMEWSMKKIDWEKIQKELDESIKKINLDKDKMKLELEKAMKEVDVARIKADMEHSIAKIDWEKITAELERVKKIDFNKIEEDLKKIQPELERSMNNAKKNIEKAKTELTLFKTFVDDLEKDGLINKKEPYTIEHEDGVLTINGKKQPTEVYNKYKSFLEKHKDFTIKKSGDDFNIDID